MKIDLKENIYQWQLIKTFVHNSAKFYCYLKLDSIGRTAIFTWRFRQLLYYYLYFSAEDSRINPPIYIYIYYTYTQMAKYK